ncbi:translation elongation factor EF1B gamma NDAI_0C00370 [Naumovozyma dairenensis CBS 421]|uniref:Elongation factor 1-gamma 1 n=1 Tax=Naumovozyma dairenensis (strain ATCC 10597 / BCRC 20456 / CBS 421 / NBRC 0211 / NRRL Y-12639) TaxID=1071378 RepID=G0W7D7_NAUDC|nr:hypothetical protein NDAI_0C00370 [Naumovozyma dairenensis CBS 421]CCD23698.1 hypothetical protein NDAI_0C00370 [Naumovozyma dairenensis CBS 421]
MSQGTLYAHLGGRGLALEALIEHFNLDFEVVECKGNATFEEKFPLKMSPALVGPKGAKLTETIAIAYYLVNFIEDEKVKAKLVGSTEIEKAQVLRWISFANMEVGSNWFKAFASITGSTPFNKKEVDAAFAKLNAYAAAFEVRLRDFTYLATENVSLADMQAVSTWGSAFKLLLGEEFRSKYPHLMRWFKTVSASPIMASKFEGYQFIEKTLQFVPPKKEKKAEKKPKAEQKPKVEKKPEAEADAEAAPAKKPKHPLEALGKSTFILDEWKRQYSNEDTRPVALPWFWEHYNPEEYSLWKVDYKYNDELTLTFMSNNLVGGFFNRLSASTKYMFGCLVVYGENNNNGITGAIMVRGQDNVPAFNVAPDWESYSYSKLDPTKEEDKEFINNMWAWDKPVVVNGESKEIVDGKVLK